MKISGHRLPPARRRANTLMLAGQKRQNSKAAEKMNLCNNINS